MGHPKVELMVLEMIQTVSENCKAVVYKVDISMCKFKEE